MEGSPPTTEMGKTAVEEMGGLGGNVGASGVWREKCSVGLPLRYPGKGGGKSSCIYGSVAQRGPKLMNFYLRVIITFEIK